LALSSYAGSAFSNKKKKEDYCSAVVVLHRDSSLSLTHRQEPIVGY
jgi:hypothetical protein